MENINQSKIDISQIIKNNKKILSIFPGSRLSEINVLLPILLSFIKEMNKKYKDLFFVFHTTNEHIKKIQDILLKDGLKNCGAISDEKIKSEILKSSIFAVAKSGTISLEICNAKVPSIIIYKMLVKVKFANIINISANKEIIPELIQSKCNSINIYNTVDKLLNNKEDLKKQVLNFETELSKFKTKNPSEIASTLLINHF